MAVETKGPINSTGPGTGGFNGVEAAGTLQISYSGEAPKGHATWEFFDGNGASIYSGSSALAGLATGAVLYTFPDNNASSFKITLAGKFDNFAIYTDSISNSGMTTTGSGHVEVTGYASPGA